LLYQLHGSSLVAFGTPSAAAIRISGIFKMHVDWDAFLKGLSPGLKELRTVQPEVMDGFSAISKAALKQGVLDTKTKELIALGISVAMRCDDCIGFHVKAALDKGTTREEVMETLGMSIYMGAGPSVMYAAHVVAAFDQFSARAAVRAEKVSGHSA